MAMTFVYKQIFLKPGEQFTLRDGDVLSGSSMQINDAQGRDVVVVAHVMMRVEAPPVMLPVNAANVEDRN